MCGIVVIVTRWWLAWLLVTVACVMCLLGANLSPSWLLRASSTPVQPTSSAAFRTSTDGLSLQEFTTDFLQDQFSATPVYRPQEREALGLWIRCTLMGGYERESLHCGVYATTVPDLPIAQIISLTCVVTATVLTSLSCIAVLFSTCVRIVRGANWFTIVGATQALAGILSLVGVAVFPLAWGSDRIRTLCGESDMYNPSNCTIGWAVYVALVGSLGLLLCTWMSSIAARSTTTEEVAEEISKGKTIVCLI
ncbi:hypothetical protein SK128_006844 [Halocaridina rubra]|uniref:Uncharacterized protein n=1 Tax=Halocaridina rubra TaxID=373956 RepID=A0AAN8XEM5_HALRR